MSCVHFSTLGRVARTHSADHSSKHPMTAVFRSGYRSQICTASNVPVEFQNPDTAAKTGCTSGAKCSTSRSGKEYGARSGCASNAPSNTFCVFTLAPPTSAHAAVRPSSGLPGGLLHLPECARRQPASFSRRRWRTSMTGDHFRQPRQRLCRLPRRE